jgi:mRNA interferase MazF
MNAKPGDIWLADLGLAVKTRPVLIVSRFDPDAPHVCSDAGVVEQEGPEGNTARYASDY